MTERFKVAALKADDLFVGSVGSNPTASAIMKTDELFVGSVSSNLTASAIQQDMTCTQS
jgi:ABC-type taurine transport system substrate-binding protein